jgi:hypothetical protein
MGMSDPFIELHIEELILHGFDPGDRFRIGDAVHRELSRLLAERGLPGLAKRSVSIERLDRASFKVPSSATADAIGRQMARAVYGQVSSPGRGKGRTGR